MSSLRIVALATLLTFPIPVLSCSCMGLNLEQHFHLVPNVFTAVITGVEFVECPDNGSIRDCRSYEAEFELTRLYKGDTPFRVIKSHVGGASCGTSLAVGVEYLFFIGDAGNTGMCSGTRVVTNAEPWVVQDLERIENFVAGRSPDLSSPWHSQDFDGMCTLGTDFLVDSGEKIPYAGKFEVSLRKTIGQHAQYRPYLENEVGFTAVLVTMPVVQNPDELPVEIKIGGESIPMVWQADDRGWGGRYALYEDDAAQFISQLDHPGEIRIEGSIPKIGDVGAQIRMTHVGTAIDEFLDCISTPR